MKKHHLALILFVSLLVLNFMLTKPYPTIRITKVEELEKILSKPQNDINIKLASGVYDLNYKAIIDSSCGNCEDPDTLISATAGLIISGRNIHISGPADQSAIIKTNSGYGLYVLNCGNCTLENLTITGGIRNINEFATDAAIVVKNSNVTIRNNKITRNYGNQELIKKNIVGIMGICGREDSFLNIYNNLITKNSWDGIALYRNSEAIIAENIIDGVHKAGSRIDQGGRGVGIGITWNAKADIRNNLIKRYWKGIGIFVDAEATIVDNIIEDISAWGISICDAGKGEPRGYIKNNIIYKTGAMGISITSTTEENPGFFKANIVVRTAQDSTYDSSDYYGYQCALAEQLVPEKFEIKDNIFYDNRRADLRLPDYDTDLHNFEEKLKVLKEMINRITILEDSDFYHDLIE